MNNITDYRVLAEGTIQDLEKRVLEVMLYGWQPLGGMVKLGTDWGVAQTMVKYTDVKPRSKTPKISAKELL